MKTRSAHASASRPWATWYDSPSPPLTSPGAAPHSRTSYGMLARVVNTCAGMPTSSGLAPSRTRTATRRRRGGGTRGGGAGAGGGRGWRGCGPPPPLHPRALPPLHRSPGRGQCGRGPADRGRCGQRPRGDRSRQRPRPHRTPHGIPGHRGQPGRHTRRPALRPAHRRGAHGPQDLRRHRLPPGRGPTHRRSPMPPPLGDIAHIGHTQLFTPDLDASVAFFTDYLGLTVNGQDGDTVYLRTYDDYEHHSLVLTAREQPGLGRLALRTADEAALHRRIKAVEGSGGTGRWVEDEPGLGKLYVTTDPDGHEHALYWESEYYRAPEELRPALKNQPQAKPNRGVGLRRLDHINFLAADVLANAEFQQNVLGARPTEQIRLDSGRVAARWLTFTDKSYDVVYTEDWTASRRRGA